MFSVFSVAIIINIYSTFELVVLHIAEEIIFLVKSSLKFSVFSVAIIINIYSTFELVVLQ